MNFLKSEINEVRELYSPVHRTKHGRIPVIVQTKTTRSNTLAFQYWTQEMIEGGKITNADGSTSELIERI